jgi:hypothetical protein
MHSYFLPDIRYHHNPISESGPQILLVQSLTRTIELLQSKSFELYLPVNPQKITIVGCILSHALCFTPTIYGFCKVTALD